VPVIVRRVDKKKAGNGWWSDKERYQAVSCYLVIGNWRLTAAATNIPEETLRRWGHQDWWKEASDEIRKSNKIELSGKIKDVISKTILQLDDRVSNGDFFYNPKTGKFDRKPINASVASKITNDLIARTGLLEKEIDREHETNEGLDDRLKKLRDEMIRFSKAITIEAVPTEESNELLPEAALDVPQVQASGTNSPRFVPSPSDPSRASASEYFYSDISGASPDSPTSPSSN
jgi:hypothetical protein